MPFEYGFIPEGDSRKCPAGLLKPDAGFALARYNDDGYEVLVLRTIGDESVDIHVLPQEKMALYQGVLPFDELDDSTRDGIATPDDPYFAPFRNRQGEEATVYVSYLSIGSRVVFLADGGVQFVDI